MLVQIRAARIVTPLAVPACAALIADLWRRLRSGPGLLPALGGLGAVLASSGFAVAIFAALLPPPTGLGPASPAGRRACLQPSAFTSLAGLPPERIMAPVDLGSHLLLFTSHSVVGAPYHRNQQGILDTYRFFDGPIDVARTILEARGIGLVVTCPAMPEMRGTLVDHTPDSFVSLAATNALPAWLVDQSLPGSPLKIYAVLPR
jgi:hypothetical protein